MTTTKREITYAIRMRNEAAADIAAFRTALSGIGTTLTGVNTKFGTLKGKIDDATTSMTGVKDASDAVSAAVKQNTADLAAMAKAAQDAAKASASALGNASKSTSKANPGSSGSGGGHGGGASFLTELLPGGTDGTLGKAITSIGKVGLTATAAGLGLLAAAETAKEFYKQINEVIEAGDRMTISVSKVTNVLGSTREVGQETYNALEQAAVKSGLKTDELVDSFVRFDTAMKGIGQTRSQVVQFTDTLTTLAHVSGTSGAAASRAFLQLSQGMSKGQLQWEDLRYLIEDMPALELALADAMGITTGQFRNMATEGKLTTQVLTDAVAKMGPDVAKKFGEMPISLESARTRLTDSADKLKADLDHALGMSSTLAGWDMFWTNMAQGADKFFDHTTNGQLDAAKRQLASLQAQAAKPSVASAFGLPGGDTELKSQIADLQKLVDTLEAKNKTVTDGEQVNADALKEQTAHTTAITDAKAAMEALGLTHAKVSEDIQKLSADIASGHDVTVEYNGVMLHASEILDRLREKATPAAQAIAALNEEMRKASATNMGGYSEKLYDAMTKAGSKDGTGNDLTAVDRDNVSRSVNSLMGVEAQGAVREAQNKELLAQAKARGKSANGGKGDGGAAERAEKNRQDAEDFARKYGTGSGALAAGAQVSSLNSQAADFDTQAALTKAPRAAAGAKQLTNALTEAQGKAREAQDAYTAFMQAGGQASADAALKVKAHTEALKLTNGTTKDATQVETQLLAAYRAEAQAKGDLEVAKDIDAAQQSISDLKQEISLRNLSTGARERELAVQRVATDLQRKGVTADPSKVKQLQSLTGQSFDLKAANDFQGTIDKTVQGYKDQAATIGLSGDALEREQMLAKAAADAFEKGTPFTAEQKRDLIAAQEQYQQLVRDMQGDPMEGFKAGLEDSLESARDTFSQMKSLVSTAMDGISTDIAQMVVTGKASWSDLTTTILEDLVKIAVERAIIAPLTGGLSSLLGGGTSLSGVADVSSSSPWASSLVSTHHAGGIAGTNDNKAQRSVSPSLFTGAPRYHTGGLAGLTSGEVPIIAKRGEAVLPTVRLPDGTMGVQSAGGGGGGAVFAPTTSITIDARGNSGTPSDPGGGKALSAQLDKVLTTAMNAHMTDFINKQRRPGGMLAKQ